MELKEIKDHWDNWAKEFTTELRATTKTPTIKMLEIDAILEAIKKTSLVNSTKVSVLEAGCGNGYNCFALANLLPDFHFTGIDYSEEMINNAKKLQENQKEESARKIDFYVGDILKLTKLDFLETQYDLIFTDRCLINLSTPELQFEALEQLLQKVKPGGYLIILENTKQNLGRLNVCRKSLGLQEKPAAQFNLFLDETQLLTFFKDKMELINVSDFGSLHDLILYVLVPSINNGETDYTHPLVKAAADLGVSLPEEYKNQFGSFGQNRLYLLQKKRLIQ